jgi:inner membrane protein YidH
MVTQENPDSVVPKERDPRVYFAAERTFLAWIRTGLALMGFGFVVARFGLFLRELSMQQSQQPGRATGPSLWLGTGLVVVGVIVNISAVVTHIREVKLLRTGAWVAGRTSGPAVALALLLSLAGIGLAAYLIWVR